MGWHDFSREERHAKPLQRFARQPNLRHIPLRPPAAFLDGSKEENPGHASPLRHTSGMHSFAIDIAVNVGSVFLDVF